MADFTSSRLSYEDSYRLLQRIGYFEDGPVPPMKASIPKYDDDSLGVSFFRTLVGDGDLENLTLPRTFFGRSQVGPLSFRNTDLSESVLCWNDFDGVDFTDCDLSTCDMRASTFNQVKFVRTNLRDADLRQSSFEECSFADADCRGVKLTMAQGRSLILSSQQRTAIDWQDDDGEEPGGG